MDLVLDVAQVAFYALGSLALILGGFLGLRRFGFERPHHSAWEITLEEGARRRAFVGGRQVFVHSFLLILTNRSFAAQRVAGYWFGLFPSSHGDFSGERFNKTPPSSDGLRSFFGREMTIVGTTVAPNRTVRFGQTMMAPTPHAVVRVCYAAVCRRPRLIWPGFHDEMIIAAVGSQIVPIRLEDVLAEGAEQEA
jgi:hypothetical protein